MGGANHRWRELFASAKKGVNMKYASRKKRFTNHLIDSWWFFIAYVLYRTGYLDNLDYTVVLVLYFLQYWITESIWGKTLGKVITKTKVLTASGEKAGVGRVLVRTLLRFIPFETFTFLQYSKSIHGGIHDWWSKTVVVEEE